jgi:predicted rRNA methylase
MQKQSFTGCCGWHAVLALAAACPERVRRVVLVKPRSRDNELRLSRLQQLLQPFAVVFEQSSIEHLTVLSGQSSHQGIFVEYKQLQSSWQSIVDGIDRSSLFLLLDGVQDPHNLGACLRTAWAAGVTAVIAPKDNAVGLTPVVHKVASGAAACVPYVQVTNLARAMRALQKAGVWLYGADESANTDAFSLQVSSPVGLVMGAEGRGLRRLTRDGCDELCRIPTAGDFSTLNVSVASGVLLFNLSMKMDKLT